MKLGFNYHISYSEVNGEIFVPDFFGIFLHNLAENLNKLVVFLHKNPSITSEENYHLCNSKITVVDIGEPRTFYSRFFNPSKELKVVSKWVSQLDCLLVRAPSPLAPHIWFRFNKQLPVYFFLVGSYTESAFHIKTIWYRKVPIVLLLNTYQLFQNFAVKRTRIISNSLKILQEYKGKTLEGILVKTSNLDSTSFYTRYNTCLGEKITILYTGRIEVMKGLRELLLAFYEFNKIVEFSELRIVGWEEGTERKFENELKELASKLDILDKVVFTGRLNLGEQINSEYRNADIYVLPSYAEGFPRAIWEAMANSLPVVATNVGSIPYFLKSEENCLLIEPKSESSILKSILRFYNEGELRKKVIKNASLIVNDLTIENQSAKLAGVLRKFQSK